MRFRFLMIIPALALAGVAAGCAGKSVFQGGWSVTASVQNPVTPKMLYDVENALTVAVSGMLAYKRLCIQKAIPSSCRGAVLTLQGYVARARPVLVRLRVFVRNNDQINAIDAYNQVRDLLLSFQATSATVPGVATLQAGAK